MEPALRSPDASDDGERLEQLERAIAVLESFDREHPAMTLRASASR